MSKETKARLEKSGRQKMATVGPKEKQMSGAGYRESIVRVLKYIESNYDKKISLQTLSKVARISMFHFHRIFSSYMGVSLAQYVKNRRMEAGLRKITLSNEKMTDIAMSSGYDSPSAFNKAFRKEVGKSPTEVRKAVLEKKENIMAYLKNKSVPFLGFQKLSPTSVFYVRKTGNYFVSAKGAWESLFEVLEKSKVQMSDDNFIGMAHDNPHAEDVDEENIRFDACVIENERTQELSKFGLSSTTIEGGRYAVFLHKGPYETLGDSYHYIYGQWLYNEDQKVRDLPTFVRYRNLLNFRTLDPQELETEIFIPIKE